MMRKPSTALVVVLVLIAVISVAKLVAGKKPATLDAAAGAVCPTPVLPADAAAKADSGLPSEPTPDKPRKPAEKPLPAVLEMGSVGCIPCEHMAPIIAALEKELAGKITIKFHDVGKEPALADEYKIMTIPTQVFLDAEGKELFRHTGVFEREEILAKLRELGMLKE